jgi:Protein of unknown function (DUF3551)
MKPAKDSYGDHTMRCWIIAFAATVTAMPLAAASATGAQAQEYCGFTAHLGAVVQCGYSNRESCENAIGKGAMCFVNPYLVLNTKRPTPVSRHLEVTA